jgi:group II intron reverse transcriptase/maturase
MTISYSSLLSAFEGVKHNRGCAGVDLITLRHFENNLELNLRILEHELHSKIYFPLPLMQIFVAKKNGEPRKLCIPAVRDRVVQKAVLQRVEAILEKEFADCSFAYRKGRSVRQAVYKIKELHHQGCRWIVNADVDDFFDTVDHELLTEKFERVVKDSNIRRLVKTWLAAEVWNGTALTRLEKGIPQGSPLSPILSNLFLDELDEEMLKAGYGYVRYADDFLILCKTREKAEEALALCEAVLSRLRLVLGDKDISTFKEGFKYLGVMFLGDLIMKPFDVPKKKNKVLFYPKPFDMEGWVRGKRSEVRGEG